MPPLVRALPFVFALAVPAGARAQCLPERPDAATFALFQIATPANIAKHVRSLHPGGRAPVPETPERYRPVPAAGGEPLSDAERRRFSQTYLDAVEGSFWLGDASHGARAPAPLRQLASILHGTLAIAAARPDLRSRALAIARRLGEVALRASTRTGFAGAPFPYWRGRDGRLGRLAEAAAQALEACGRLDEAVADGWIVLAERPEEHFYDTGRVGEALALLHAATDDPRPLAWVRGASDWAARQPVSPNFNYNAFPAQMDVAAFEATGERIFLDRALARIERGVVPGQIVEGPDAGHWIDPHNERLVYRTIMARALVAASRAARGRIANGRAQALRAAARRAVGAIEGQLRANGVSDPQGVIELHAEMARGDRIVPDPLVAQRIRRFARAALRQGRAEPGAAAALAIARPAVSRRGEPPVDEWRTRRPVPQPAHPPHVRHP